MKRKLSPWCKAVKIAMIQKDWGVSEMGRAIASIEHQAFSQAVQAAPEEKQEAPAQVPEKQSEPEAEVKRYKATFWCKGTLEQIKALGDYMRANNIEFGKVAK